MMKIWKFLTSTRLAIVLTLLISVDVLTGTILLSSTPKALGTINLEIFFSWLSGTGLNNPSTSWWIFLLLALLILFIINTITCTVDSIAGLVRTRAGGARIHARRVLAQAIHVGFVIGLVGHLVSSTSGFRTMNNYLLQGDTLTLPQNDSLVLRLNKVDVAYTGSGGMQKMDAYVSLIRNGEIIREKVVSLNEPLLYQGNAVYITHHGEMPDSMQFRLSGDGKAETLKIRFQQGSETRKNGYAFRTGRLVPDFVRGSTGEIYSASEDFRNPAQEINIYKGEKPLISGWFFFKYPDRAPLAFDGLELTFAGLAYKPYAVLTINKDPGAMIVLSGAMIFLLSLIGLLFMNFRLKSELLNPGSYHQE